MTIIVCMRSSLMSSMFKYCMKSIIRAHIKYNTPQIEDTFDINDITLSICGAILTLYANKTNSFDIQTIVPELSNIASDAIVIRSDGIGVSHKNLDTQRKFLKRKRDVVATLKNTKKENKKIRVNGHISLSKFKSLDRKLYIKEKTDPTDIDLFEINTLKTLKHKNVIKLIQFYASETKIIVMYQQCVNSIDNILRSVTCDTIKTQYALQIIHGVNYIHTSNLIHCNLVASNILLTHDHIVKITNFKLARTNEKFYCDKLNTAYEPPEEEWNMSRDIYAIGRLFVDLNIKTIHGLLSEVPRNRIGYINDMTYDIKVVLSQFKRPQKAKPVGSISDTSYDLDYNLTQEYILPAAIKQQLL